MGRSTPSRRTIKSDHYFSDVYTYRRAIHLVLMISTRFRSPGSSRVQSSEEIATPQPSSLDKVPAFFHDALAIHLLRLGIVDVAESSLEPLRSITSRIAAAVQTTSPSDPDARKGKNSQAVVIRVDDDAAKALQASSIYACDVIHERAQNLQGSTTGWNGDGITAAGISAWFFRRPHSANDDGLPSIFVSMVS